MAVMNMRVARRKIRSVSNIQKITAAMKMVAAARLRRVQEKVTAGKPYASKMRELVEAVGPYARDVKHPLLTPRENRENLAVVVIAGEKGLCGSFNNNILRKAQQHIDRLGAQRVKLITVGRRAELYFRKRGYDVVESLSQPVISDPLPGVRDLAEKIRRLYEDGVVDEVQIAYTEFITTMRQVPSITTFLPIEPPRSEVGSAAERQYIFEPDAKRLLEALIPKFVENQVYKFLLESMASEQGARMTAMSNATDNAGELIEELTRMANKARQATITKELLEVVSGAEALAK